MVECEHNHIETDVNNIVKNGNTINVPLSCLECGKNDNVELEIDWVISEEADSDCSHNIEINYNNIEIKDVGYRGLSLFIPGECSKCGGDVYKRREVNLS
jgi:hypothetical protein